ncbi:MAG: DUF4097 family beta strand repeat protein [Clostridia bacterium]|nr:DUF4097 family beta strand repeat protein [Clostridia bacterium]
MNKGLKIWLIAGTALLLLGLILFGGVMTMLRWDFSKLSTQKYDTREHEIKESFQSVTVVTKTADVTFLPSEGDDARVVCYEQKKMAHTVTLADGTLKIELHDTRKWYDYIGFDFDSPKLTVYLPAEVYGALCVTVSTGCVSIPSDLSFERIDVKSTTGDVTCSASVKDEIFIQTSTGDITLEGVTARTLSLSVSTGKVSVKDAQCEGGVSVTVSTGKTQLTNLSCGTLFSEGDTGSILLSGVIAQGRMEIERDTGDVHLDGCDAAEIVIETDTGDVTGTLLSEKVFVPRSDTGRIEVPETTSGGLCKITTDTGDIQIDIVK